MTDGRPDDAVNPPMGGRRTMDRHIEQLTENLERLDRLLRGNGAPGLVASWHHAQLEIRAHAEQLAMLTSLPRDLDDLKSALANAAAKTAELTAKVDGLVTSAERERILSEGETRAVTKAGKWLRITAGALALVGIGGTAGLVAAIERLGRLAELIK